MVWQLLQVRHLQDTPLIMVGQMWKSLVQWARDHMLDPARTSSNAEDLAIPHCVATGDEAIAVIREHHGRWRARRGEAGRRPGGARRGDGNQGRPHLPRSSPSDTARPRGA